MFNSLFTDPDQNKVTDSLFRGGVTLAQGGSLSQAALAGLNQGAAPNGTPAEPPIVEVGVRSANVMDAKTKRGLLILGGIVVLAVLLMSSK